MNANTKDADVTHQSVLGSQKAYTCISWTERWNTFCTNKAVKTVTMGQKTDLSPDVLVSDGEGLAEWLGRVQPDGWVLFSSYSRLSCDWSRAHVQSTCDGWEQSFIAGVWTNTCRERGQRSGVKAKAWWCEVLAGDILCSPLGRSMVRSTSSVTSDERRSFNLLSQNSCRQTGNRQVSISCGPQDLTFSLVLLLISSAPCPSWSLLLRYDDNANKALPVAVSLQELSNGNHWKAFTVSRYRKCSINHRG